MRYLFLCLVFCLLAVSAQAQDVLKMIDGTEKAVKLIGVQDGKIIYYELGDPLTLEKDMPKNRVTKIIHEDGVIENFRKDGPKPGAVVIRKSAAPDTAREAVVLKTTEEIPAKILSVEPTEVVIRHRKGPKMGYQDRIRKEAIAKLRYADGTERDIGREVSESVLNSGRSLFNFYDETGPDLFFRYHFVTQAASSHGRLFNPDEVQSFKRFTALRDAVNNRSDVRFLDLRGKGLNSVPHDVLTLKRLVALDLSNNPLNSFPDEVLELPNLQYLWVDSCQLSELKPKWDNKKSSNLIYLSARGNSFTELNPAVGQLPSLYVLRLDNNKIRKVKGKGLFGSSPDGKSSLAIVSLSRNGLDELPSGLGAFPQMRYLGCRGNDITEATATAAELTKLNFLDLGQNPLTKLDPAVLKLAGLEVLQLDNTKLTKLPPVGWATAKKLEWITLPASAAPLPGEIWRTPSLHRFSITGQPANDAKPATIPALLPDSLSEADLTGLAGAPALALALKARRPNMKLRYFHPLMGKVQESGSDGPAELSEYLKVREGQTDPALRLAQALARTGDYGLALTALAGGSMVDTAASDRLRLEQARLLAQPQVQEYLAPNFAVRDYTSVTDAERSLATCQSLRLLKGICAHATGEAAHAPCAEAGAILKRAADSLEKLAVEGNPKNTEALKEAAGKLRAEAGLLEKK